MPCAYQRYIQDQHNVSHALTTDMHICLSFTAARDQVHIIWQRSLQQVHLAAVRQTHILRIE